MYGVPPQGHLYGQTRDNSNTHFFHSKKEHVCMCSYNISVGYKCRIICCLKEFALFNHIPHKHGMLMSLEIYKKNAKNEAYL